MLLNPLMLEWIGYVGSIVVAVSLTMSSIKKLRWYNLVGASIFSFYGFAIGALPVGFLNLFIVFADLYYLYKMYSYRESFESIEVEATDAYTHFFIKHYRSEIHEFFPHFEKEYADLQNSEKQTFTLLLMRDAVVAGVFMGVAEGDTFRIYLDFVTAPYRDFKPGDFVYKRNTTLFKSKGIKKIVCITDNKTHQKYLRKMGFEAKTNNTSFEIQL